jgi:hypothetical protein
MWRIISVQLKPIALSFRASFFTASTAALANGSSPRITLGGATRRRTRDRCEDSALGLCRGELIR